MTLKKVLVAGGAGFIGSHVVDSLLNIGHTVFVLDNFSSGHLRNLSPHAREGLTIVSGDITSPVSFDLIQQIRPEILILLAAQPSVAVSMKNPLLDVSSNLFGLVNMLEAAKTAKCSKILFATSGGTIFGEVSPNSLPISEDSPLMARSFYGLSKLTALAYLDMYKKFFDLDYAALALGNVYGPRQSGDGESGVVAIFAQKMARGERCCIFGDGNTTRDFIYVSDVADAFISALGPGVGLVNIGTGKETSVLEIHAALMLAAPHAQLPEFSEQLPGEVRRISLDSGRAEYQLGWRAKVGLVQGLSQTYDWISKNTSNKQ